MPSQFGESDAEADKPGRRSSGGDEYEDDDEFVHSHGNEHGDDDNKVLDQPVSSRLSLQP